MSTTSSLKDQTHRRGLALMVMGTSGSGKSSIAEGLAKHYNTVFIEGDHFHPLSNKTKMSTGIPLDDEDRWPWLSTIRDEVYRRLSKTSTDQKDGDEPSNRDSQGNHAQLEYDSVVVVACSCLKKSYRDYLMAHNHKSPVEVDTLFVYLQGSYDLILKRVEARQHHFMKSKLLESQFETLEEPNPSEEKVVIVGIDGTLHENIDSAINLVRDYILAAKGNQP